LLVLSSAQLQQVPEGMCVKIHASLMLLFLQKNKAYSVGFHLLSIWSKWSMRKRKKTKDTPLLPNNCFSDLLVKHGAFTPVPPAVCE